jgi:hypothetical protein
MLKGRWQVSVLMATLVLSAGAVRGAEVDKYVPGDTEILVRVNFKQILESPLFKKNIGKLREQIMKVEEVKDTLEALGFDPFKDLDTVTIAAVGASDPEKALIVAHGKFNTEKFKAKGESAAKEGGELKIVKEGGHTLYEVSVPNPAGERPIYVAIIDASTIAASPSKSSVVDALAVSEGKKEQKVKKDLQQLIEKSDADHSIAIFALGTAIPAEQLEGVKHIVGHITLTDSIQAHFAILTSGSDKAKDLAKTIEDGLEQGKNFLNIFAMQQKELAPLTGLVDTLKVSSEGNTVHVKGKISKETIEQLEKARPKD